MTSENLAESSQELQSVRKCPESQDIIADIIFSVRFRIQIIK